jgi:hypothetical protein
MNKTFNRDLKYTFAKRCINPVQTALIDEAWMKEKNIEMEITMPFKNIDSVDEDNFKHNNDLNNWNDIGLQELLGKHLNYKDDINFK